MVYEKYIRKNGKLYGPYTYHSKRVNGKVVSEYHGTGKKENNFNLFLILGLFIGVVLVLGLFFLNSQFTGRVSLDISSSSDAGEILEGVLSLSLKEGELIPASSKVIFDVNGSLYEYSLSDIVGENSVSGNFYIEEKNLSGSGEGFGVVGTKVVYPQVGFTINILSESESVGSSGGDGSSLVVSEESETNLEGEQVLTIISEETGETVQTEDTEKTESQFVEEDAGQESQEETIDGEATDSSINSDETERSEPESESEPQKEEKEEEESEPAPEPEPSPEVTATGAVIANLFRNTINAFLVLTGQVSLELAQEVGGIVSFGESFTYSLDEGETAEIKEGSVNVNGEVLSDNSVDLSVINNQVIVTTEYSALEEGFGEDYLGGSGETISINLSELNLELGGESIKVSFVYDNTELVSVSTTLDGEVETPDGGGEIPDSPTNVSLNITNETEIPLTNVSNETEVLENVTEIVNISGANITTVVELLTDEERVVLENKYGNVSVEITTAEKVRDRVEVTFGIGEYSVTHSYDSDLSSSELEGWIKRDRIRLLKDIAYELSKETTDSESLEGIVGSYSI